MKTNIADEQWLSWHPKGNVLAAGCEDATVWLWNRESFQALCLTAIGLAAAASRS